jgi:hypothetical protein
VAIVFGLCGAGLVISANTVERDVALGNDAAAWQWIELAFGMGMLLCFALTLTLVIEGVVRFYIKLRGDDRFQFSLRTLLIIMTLLAVLCGLVASFAN